MERRFARKHDEHLPFIRLLKVFLFPAVFVLTKIGEYTVLILTVIIRLSIKIAIAAFLALKRIHIPKLATPSLPQLKLALPSLLLRLPKKKRRRLLVPPKVIYPIPFRAKLSYIALGVALASALFAPVTVRLWLSELPNPKELAFRQPPLTTKIYDRNRKLLFQIYATQNRSRISLSSVPKHVIEATIAIEDKNFYRHGGFDLEAIVRAARETFINRNLQGGSTITQQLIKSTLLSPEVSLERKIKEILLAFWAERIFSKDEILQMYFNQVPYGGTAWGIEAAAKTYFGKEVKELTLSEGALLAGLPSGPTLYSPFGADPSLSKKRQAEVLERMVALGFITKEEAKEALEEKLTFAAPAIDIRAPHFVMYVKELLTRRFGIRAVEQGGLKVTTTLDLEIQEKVQAILKEEIGRLAALSVQNGAALVTNPQSGEILAMVGSRDYFDEKHGGNFNVTTSPRQPGSSIKIVTYASALEKGLTAASILDDSPITYNQAGSPPYSPVNYDGRFHGKLILRDAFGNSYNVPAVKTLSQIGIPSMVEMGKRLGITTWDDDSRFGLSLTLGGGEVKMTDLAVVYGTIAGGGIRQDLTPILKVESADGEVLEELRDRGWRVLKESIAFILADILADNGARTSAFGPSSVLQIPRYRASVKTGTSDNKRDNWTIGFAKDTLVAVWVGNNDNSPMHPTLTSGITGAAPIWNRIMTMLLADKPSDSPAPPSEIVTVPICAVNGLLPCSGCPTRTEYFVEGTEPKLACKPDLITPAPAIGGSELSPAAQN